MRRQTLGLDQGAPYVVNFDLAQATAVRRNRRSKDAVNVSTDASGSSFRQRVVARARLGFGQALDSVVEHVPPPEKRDVVSPAAAMAFLRSPSPETIGAAGTQSRSARATEASRFESATP